MRNNKGEMVPLSALTKFESRPGPEFTMRYNVYRSAQINGAAAPGYSSGQAMKALEEVFEQTMPREMGYDYLGMSFQEKKAQQGVSPAVIFGFSLLFVFLILAALYESWSLPFSVLLSTPVAVFGAFAVLWLRRVVLGAFLPPYMVQIENDVYSQIGLVMLIGLAAKNAILIVEFAKDEFEKGKPLVDAALEGARLRLRPILMTSFAFILGCVPLWTAIGRGVGGPPDHGHHGDRRHAGRERDRHLLHSRDLLCGGEALGRRPRRHAPCGDSLSRHKETDVCANHRRRCWLAGDSARRLHRGSELPPARDTDAPMRSARRRPRRLPIRHPWPISSGWRFSRTNKLQELDPHGAGAKLRPAGCGGAR